MFETLINFIFPPRCPNCSAYVEQRAAFCCACGKRLTGLRAIAVPREMTDAVEGIWALGHYREGLRDLLRALKYQRRKSTLPYLHGILPMGEPVLAQLPRSIVAAAVPLSVERRRTRGFNQTEEIFAPWLAAHDIPLIHALERVRDTEPLYEHTREERRHELRHAFAAVDAAHLAGKDVLLLDDIMTTGATLAECARTLRAAGAGRIWALVLTSEHR